MPEIWALVLLHLLRVSWRSKSAWQSAVFAAFAERYQIWAAGAHPLVGVAARKKVGSEGWRRGEKRGKRKEVGGKGKVFKKQQSIIVVGKLVKGWKGRQVGTQPWSLTRLHHVWVKHLDLSCKHRVLVFLTLFQCYNVFVSVNLRRKKATWQHFSKEEGLSRTRQQRSISAKHLKRWVTTSKGLKFLLKGRRIYRGSQRSFLLL